MADEKRGKEMQLEGEDRQAENAERIDVLYRFVLYFLHEMYYQPSSLGGLVDFSWWEGRLLCLSFFAHALLALG